MIEQYKSFKVYAITPNTKCAPHKKRKENRYILFIVASLDIFQLGNLEEIEKLLDKTCKAMSRAEGIKITYELSFLTAEEERAFLAMEGLLEGLL
jgi:hypothetical protein